MLIFQGKSVYGGVSIGRIKILRKNKAGTGIDSI